MTWHRPYRLYGSINALWIFEKLLDIINYFNVKGISFAMGADLNHKDTVRSI